MLSLSSVTFAVNVAAMPRTAGLVTCTIFTSGALLIGSVKRRHPDTPSAAVKAKPSAPSSGW